MTWHGFTGADIIALWIAFHVLDVTSLFVLAVVRWLCRVLFE